MNRNERTNTQRPDDHRCEDPRRPDRRERPRQNPRLVYNDPDRFFRDLLMEQQEQS